MLLFFAFGIKISSLIPLKHHKLQNCICYFLVLSSSHTYAMTSFSFYFPPQGLIFVFLPQRPCCYRLISHPGEHAVECIIISQYRQKKQNNFREMLNSPNQNVKMCVTWVFRKAPFDIDLKMKDGFDVGNGDHFYKSAE